MLPKGTHDYKTFIKPSELSQSARAAGLELQGMVGLNTTRLTNVSVSAKTLMSIISRLLNVPSKGADAD